MSKTKTATSPPSEGEPVGTLKKRTSSSSSSSPSSWSWLLSEEEKGDKYTIGFTYNWRFVTKKKKSKKIDEHVAPCRKRDAKI